MTLIKKDKERLRKFLHEIYYLRIRIAFMVESKQICYLKVTIYLSLLTQVNSPSGLPHDIVLRF